MKQLSLRPYTGKLYLAETRREYAKLHQEIFKSSNSITTQDGRFDVGCGKDGCWTYLIWARNSAALAHELSHVLFHTFERVGINPKHDDGEVFCYMLSQLMLDTKTSRKKK